MRTGKSFGTCGCLAGFIPEPEEKDPPGCWRCHGIGIVESIRHSRLHAYLFGVAYVYRTYVRCPECQ